MEGSKFKKKSYVLPSVYKECCASIENMGDGENANMRFSEFLRAVYVAIPLLHMFWDKKYSSLIEQTSRLNQKVEDKS